MEVDCRAELSLSRETITVDGWGGESSDEVAVEVSGWRWREGGFGSEG